MIKVMLLLMLKRKFSTLRLLQVNTTSGLIQIHLILEKPLREQFQDWKWVQWQDTRLPENTTKERVMDL